MDWQAIPMRVSRSHSKCPNESLIELELEAFGMKKN
jgi:hypothetical protein